MSSRGGPAGRSLSGIRLVPVAFAFAALGWPLTAAAQEVVRGPDGSVSVHASAVPLKKLLGAVDQVWPFQRLSLDAEIEDHPVTVALDGVTVRQSLVAILKASGVNYVISADDEGRSIRVAAGNRAIMAEARGRSLTSAPPPAVPTDSAQPQLDASLPVANQTDSAPSDSSEAENLAILQQALSPPLMKPQPGSLIQLPFPGPDGQPLTAVVPPAGTPVALPFPVTAPAPVPVSRPTPVPTSPQFESPGSVGTVDK